MDFNKYLESVNIEANNQRNQRQLSSNPNSSIEKHIAHNNYDDKTKQNVLSKLKNLIDANTAMKIFNYLVSNNLINVFLECYDYLTTLKLYNPLTYTEIINYVIDYNLTNKQTSDLLKQELKDLMNYKVNKEDLQNYKRINDNVIIKDNLDKMIKTIIDKSMIDKTDNTEILQSYIDIVEDLPNENDFKENPEEAIIGSAPYVDVSVDELDKKFSDLTLSSKRYLTQEEIDEMLPPLDIDIEEEEEVIETAKEQKDREQEEKDLEVKKRFPELYSQEEIKKSEEEIKKRGGRKKGSTTRPLEIRLAEKAEKEKRAQERIEKAREKEEKTKLKKQRQQELDDLSITPLAPKKLSK